MNHAPEAVHVCQQCGVFFTEPVRLNHYSRREPILDGTCSETCSRMAAKGRAPIPPQMMAERVAYAERVQVRMVRSGPRLPVSIPSPATVHVNVTAD